MTCVLGWPNPTAEQDCVRTQAGSGSLIEGEVYSIVGRQASSSTDLTSAIWGLLMISVSPLMCSC